MSWLLVILGAAVGAPLRYLTDRAVQTRHDTIFPWGTFTVNIVGSLILGALSGMAADPHVQVLVGTGLCGALTTYSTFGYETLQLARTRARFQAVANLAATIIGGLGAYYTGTALAQALS
ncbi:MULTISPECIES: fluoride efflux transporter CrcB [unclassified Nocardia]|uniref:fluoride efflux transporter CrcB n=1 Tax=unclassified Nocardia TaxID=2637762 RepID=UPI001CE46FD4|nr:MULTISPECIES: fluoride efflux transporter CrcB [unclassified Nocardia]